VLVGPTVDLPSFHKGQREVYNLQRRHNVLVCGRRFGKSIMGTIMASEALGHRCRYGWFAPTYKYLEPQFEEIATYFDNKPGFRVDRSKNRLYLSADRRISIDFWTCEKPDPGRGFKYHGIVVDEAGIIRDLKSKWEQSIRATLSDYRGGAWFLGTPKGASGYFMQLFSKGQSTDPEDAEWASFRRGTVHNPFIDRAEIEAASRELPPDIFKQEYEGFPADDGGNPFGLEAIKACFKPGMRVVDPKPWVFGVDLASKHDYTWIIGINRQGQVVVSERFQFDWPTTKQRILHVCGRIPTLVDETGVGDPVVADLQAARGNFEGFRFSNTSKQMIMVGLRNNIQLGEIQFDDQRLKDELDMFCYEFKENRVIYTAPEGLHDDGVCALALACELVRQGPTRGALRANEIITRGRRLRT